MRTLALALALALPGCALLSAKAPNPQRRVDQAPDCHSGKTGVAVDGIMTGTLGLMAIGISGESAGAGVVTGLIAAAYLGSALSGNSSADKCRAAVAEHDAHAARRGQLGGLPIAPPSGSPDEDGDDPDERNRRRPPLAVRPATPTPARPTAPAPARPTAPAPGRPTAAAPTPPAAPAATATGDDETDDAAPAPADDAGGDLWNDFWQEVPR